MRVPREGVAGIEPVAPEPFPQALECYVAVAPRLEAGVRTEMFAGTLAAVTKARAELSRRGSHLAGRLGSSLGHGDVRPPLK